MPTKDAKDQLNDQLGVKAAADLIARIDASEQRGKALEAEVVQLKGQAEDFKARYIELAARGTPITPTATESPEEFIARGVNETAEIRVTQGLRQNRHDLVKRGLSGVHDFRGLSAMRLLRCLAVSWMRNDQRISFDIAAKFATDELQDKRAAGLLEESRDMMKDAHGTDVQKMERARRALGPNIVGSGAGFLKPETYAAFMDYLHPKSVVRAAGASSLPMPNGVLRMPYLDTAASAAYRGAHGAAQDGTPSEKILTFFAKMLGGQIVMANELLKDASFAVEVFMRQHLGMVMATTADLKMIRGLGQTDEIRGFDWWFDSTKNTQVASTHKANRTLSGGNATARTIRADLLSCQELVEEEKIPSTPGDFAYLMAVATKYALLRVRDAQDRFEFADEMKGGSLLGGKFGATTQIPRTAAGDGAGHGTDNKTRVYGAHMPTVAIAEVEAPEVKIQDGAAYKDVNGTVQSGFSQNETAIAIFERHDFGCLLRGNEGKIIDSVDWHAAF